MTIDEHGQCDEHDEGDLQPQEAIDDETEVDRPYKKISDKSHTSQIVIARSGETAGCPACRATQRRGNEAVRSHHRQDEAITGQQWKFEAIRIRSFAHCSNSHSSRDCVGCLLEGLCL